MRHFDELLQELLQKVVAMSTITEGMIEMAVKALVDRNEAHVAQIWSKEQEVNTLQVEIDEKVLPQLVFGPQAAFFKKTPQIGLRLPNGRVGCLIHKGIVWFGGQGRRTVSYLFPGNR